MRSSLYISRRGLLVGIGAAASIGALAGCSGGAPRITFHQSKPEAIPHFSNLAAEFSKSQSQFSVLHDTATNLSASFVRNNPPDLGLLNYNFEIARFLERGALSDLSDLPEAGRIRDNIVELAASYPQYPDRTSTLPYSAMAAGVIYNKRIFEDNGVEVPTTWDDMLNVCDKLQSANVTPIYGTFQDAWTIMQGWFDYPAGGMVDIADFYAKMREIGPDVGPDSEVSFQKTMLEPVQKMVELVKFANPDASGRTYGDGNTAFAQDKAAMIFQGPWALGEFEKTNPDQDLGTFPLPVTDNPDDRKARVNIDLALWVPEAASDPEGGRAFLQYLMQPEVQHAYNEQFLGFSTTDDAPDVTDDRIKEMQTYYDEGRFYLGPSQFLPATIPAPNYFQSMVLGANPEPLLAQLDRDWARLAFRE